MGHAFTPFEAFHGYGDPPKFIKEGIAEYLAYAILLEMGFQDAAQQILARRISNPLSNPTFNASHFFDWNAEFEFTYYAYSLHVIKNLVGLDSMVLRCIFQAWERDRVKFNHLPSVQDRYNLLLYYLQKASGDDAIRLLRKYGLVADPSPVSTAMLIHQVLIVGESVVAFLISLITIRNLIMNRKTCKGKVLFLAIIWGFAVFWWSTFDNAFSLFYPLHVPLPFLFGHLCSFLIFDVLTLSFLSVFFKKELILLKNYIYKLLIP